MLLTLLFIVWSFVVVVLVQWIYFLLNRPKNAPPGPLPLPLIGSVYVFFFRNDLATYQYLYDNYGDAVTIYAGCSVSGMMVFALGYDTIVEVSNTPEIANVTSDRLPGINELRGVRDGILWAQYPEARERRALLHKGFKQYGLLTKLSPQQEDEMDRLLDTVNANVGQPFQPEMAVIEAVSSSILLATYGHRFDMNDKVCAELYRNFRVFTGGSRLEMSILPYLRYLKFLVPDKLAEAERNAERTMEKWLLQEVAVRRPTFNPDNMRDLLDVYMATNDNDSKLDDGFLRTVVDSFGASTGTTAAAIGWALFYLAFMPEEQERLYKMIEAVVPSHSYPSMENREELPRLRAFLEESARYSCMTAAGFPRRVAKPIAFGPNKCYHLPVDSTITLAMSPNQFEEKYWGDPHNFRVDRWLDPNDGSFLTSRRPVLQFGLGKRNCPGEIPARNVVFLTVGGFIQRFQWKLAEHARFTDRLHGFAIRAPPPMSTASTHFHATSLITDRHSCEDDCFKL